MCYFSMILSSAEMDLVPFGITFIFCVFVGLEQGILIGTAVNLGMLLYSTARPRMRIHKIQVFTIIKNAPKVNLDISKYSSLFVAIRLRSPNILSSPRIAVWCLQPWNILCQVFARPRPSIPASSLSLICITFRRQISRPLTYKIRYKISFERTLANDNIMAHTGVWQHDQKFEETRAQNCFD